MIDYVLLKKNSKSILRSRRFAVVVKVLSLYLYLQ